MTAEVLKLDGYRRRRSRPRSEAGPCPEKFSPDELQRLLAWAMRSGCSLDEVQFAWQSVRLWWETRQEPRANWVAVTMNAIRHGWGLRGYQRWHEKRGRASRTITPELIEKLVAQRREWIAEQESQP